MKTCSSVLRNVLLGFVFLVTLIPLVGCGDGGDLEEVIKLISGPADNLEIHRSVSSRSGWCSYSPRGPFSVIASSGILELQLDTARILGPRDALLELAVQATASGPNEEALFQGSLSSPQLAGLAPHITAGVSIWTIASVRSTFKLSSGGRIRVSHLIWDPTANKIYLLYSYMYG